MRNYGFIARRLSSKYTASLLDNKTFSEWHRGIITDEECFERFKKNNAIRDDVIKLDIFIDWLGTLGWKRYKR